MVEAGLQQNMLIEIDKPKGATIRIGPYCPGWRFFLSKYFSRKNAINEINKWPQGMVEIQPILR